MTPVFIKLHQKISGWEIWINIHTICSITPMADGAAQLQMPYGAKAVRETPEEVMKKILACYNETLDSDTKDIP